MNVISFSVWGDDRRFYRGAQVNAQLAKIYYPDWTCYFYVDVQAPTEWVTPLVNAGSVVFRRRITKGAWEGLFWRFEPIFDPFVSYTLSRDCDSRLNPREAAAVQDWMLSGKTLHSMRDHFEHNIPILGGMFGIKNWPKFEILLNTWTRFDKKGDDQDLLNELVWPELREQTLAHDRYARGLDMPNADGNGIYKYRPLEQLGQHEIRTFPPHDPLDPFVHGEHVGARVGVVSL